MIFFSVLLLLPLVDVHDALTVAAAAAEAQTAELADETIEDDEPTCSLDPSTNDDCSTSASSSSASTEDPPIDYGREGTIDYNDRRDLIRHVVSLTDDTFDELTLTSSPATWLIMFKTNSCAICKKARPALENLSLDADIVGHNDGELAAAAVDEGRRADNVVTEHQKQQPNEESATVVEEDEKEESRTPKGPIYVWEESKVDDGWETPKGPVYIATIDAGWSGRDTTKRFDVDATPTIILLRNDGYDNNRDDPRVDSRHYYVYRGQRAVHPLRSYVLGGYAVRKRIDMPPPLAEDERKPRSYSGRFYEHVVSPGAKWVGGIIGKMVLAWFAFMGVLGLFMRVHNYAWGGDDDADGDYEAKEREIEREKAQGRAEYEESLTAAEKSTRRQKLMWERKAKNHAKFAAKREARKNKKAGNQQGEGGDELEGVGFSVKKSDALRVANDSKKKVAKSKNN